MGRLVIRVHPESEVTPEDVVMPAMLVLTVNQVDQDIRGDLAVQESRVQRAIEVKLDNKVIYSIILILQYHRKSMIFKQKS